tara:strand:+ start:26473 stop:26967 length:495 start_codon:yes stop_codon:yes gene_type:complete
MFALTLKFLINIVPALLQIGTMLGKDPIFKHRPAKVSGPFTLAALSATDRQMFMEMTDQIMSIEDPALRVAQFNAMRFQAIAASARNKRGYYIFDPLNKVHLQKVAEYPEVVISDALDVIDELSGMPWLKFPRATEVGPLIDEVTKIDADEDPTPTEKPDLINP